MYPIIDEFGDRCWYKNDIYYRNDGPALERSDGTRLWVKNGAIHRDDGPAAEYPNRTRRWFKNGRFIKVEYK